MDIAKVVKRDNTIVAFDKNKIKVAIMKARDACGSITSDTVCELYAQLISEEIYRQNIQFISVGAIQDLVENTLISYNSSDIAKAYITYRRKRDEIRDENFNIMNTVHDIVSKDSRDMNIKRENANINSDTPMGTMLKIGSEVSKEYYCSGMLKKHISEAHVDGDIHIHDLDFYALTETCCQIDIGDLLNRGFSTGHGFLRQPSNIISASALACIIIQADQNDQHGGQSIPNFDYGLAPYVSKSFVKNIIKYCDMNGIDEGYISNIESYLKSYLDDHKLIMNDDGINYVTKVLEEYGDTDIVIPEICIASAKKYTDKDVYQAMEAFIHNMNTLHSRAGAQVPFSSINYGTDTSEEGRMIVRNVLKATWDGLGHGETPIFPIQIFKVKEGVNYNKEDTNYDLFKLAMKVSAKRLFPNFSFLDSPFNKAYYREGHPETEIAYMGCRTRVIANVADPNREIVFGRGNLSFTSINLPRIAIEVMNKLSELGNSCTTDEKLSEFYKILDKRIDLVHEQLLDRFEVQCSRKVKNYPFLMGQGVWIDSLKLSKEDSVRDVLKHGSLTTGFIGLAECLVMMFGKHHGESDEMQKIGLDMIKHMREKCDLKCKDTGLNFTLIATPAEGLSGTFVKKDKNKYGIIKGVTDREYYTNSFHVPVYYHTNAMHKIEVEAPYHAITNGGHISYIEMDGDPLKNLEAFESIIRFMHDNNIGYGSINHPVDRCSLCGYTGIINDKCPICGNNGKDPVPLDTLREVQKNHPELRNEIESCCKGE